MTQQQTKQHSGSQYHLNLDPISYAALSACQRVHRNHQNNFSNSVIVRRALRYYLDSLNVMESGEGMTQEAVETKRAAKGIL